MSPTLQAKTDSASLYLRRASVRARYDVSDAWITRKIATEGFPAPIRIGNSRDFWRIADLDAWDAAKITAERDVFKHKPPIKTKSQVVAVAEDGSQTNVTPPVQIARTYRR